MSSSVAAEPLATSSERPDGGFVKALTLTDATMLVAGSMIGSGIFLVSADIGRTVGTPFWLLMAWVLAGVITLLGALSIAELAAMYPRAGGQYVFLRESMGPLVGFLFGWTLFVVIQTGTIAAVAVAFGRFLGVLWPAITPGVFGPSATFPTPGGEIVVGLSPQRLIALISVWVLTWINLRGVKEGKWVQTVVTMVKALALASLVILGLLLGRNATALAANFGPGQFGGFDNFTAGFAVVFGAAMVGSLFSSDAWLGVTFAASEVQNPRRNLPLALLLGTGLVTLLYVTTNVAYLNMLPLRGSPEGADVMARGIQYATQDRVGTAAAEVIFGGIAPSLMAIFILISTFGCNNGLILAGARVYYAMARDRLFFRRAGELNRHSVPGYALVVQSVWTSFLCLTGTYGQLLDYVIFAALLFYALTTVGLFVLRRARPDAERPYRAFGYPVLPALYIALCTAIAICLLIADKTRAQAVSGLVLVLLGIPVYLLWRRGGSAAPSTGAAA